MKNRTEDFCGSLIIQISDAYGEVHGYASLIVCVIGIVGNVLNFLIFGRKENISPVNIVLRGLSAADLVVLILYVPYSWYMFICESASKEIYSYRYTLFLLWHSYLSQVFHTIGIWLTVVLAIWRYVAIAHPLRNKFWCNPTLTKRTVIAGYVICPILCAPIIYTFRIQRKNSYSADGALIENTTTLYILTMQQPADFMVNLNFIIYSVLLRLVPSILLTVLSAK